MSKKNKPYVVPNGRQPFFSFVKKILRLLFRRPEIILTDGEIAPGSLIVSNHSAKKGPMVMELYAPAFYVPWGASPMLGNYKSRFHYLRDVFYIKKKGYPTWIATFLAGFESIFSIFIYKGMRILPTYHGAELMSTVKKSLACMEQNVSVLVFPEYSEEGYLELLTYFHPGFVLLAQSYMRRYRQDCMVYPMYYHDKKKKLIIGKAVSVKELTEKRLSKEEIAEYFRLEVNALCHRYVLGTPEEEIPSAKEQLAKRLSAEELRTTA